MKFLMKKIYIILFLFTISFLQQETLAKDSNIQYTRENISHYFLGILSSSQDYNTQAFNHLKKIQTVKTQHSKFNIEFVRTLILLEKFDQAFSFSKSVWSSSEYLYEIDLFLGLKYFLVNDYSNAEKHFKRLNKISNYNPFFNDFIGNILLSWLYAEKNDKAQSFQIIDEIPKPYRHIVKIHKSFLECFFDTNEAQNSFEKLIADNDYNFSRYNFFLANYFLYKDKISEAKKIINYGKKEHASNLLIKHTENLLLNGKIKEIIQLFDCKNSKHNISEFFYILANLYSSENDYQMSNFYLKISLLFNDKFLTNKALLAENYYYQKRYKVSKNVYTSLKSIGPTYFWFSSKSISSILLKTKGKKAAIDLLKKNFKSLPDKNFEHYYELANFYKDNDYYLESIKYYSLALEKINKDHSLVHKILDRRGTSYERLGNWKNAEKDLKESLKIKPNQPHVLNYLAYTWIDKGINLDEGLEMLIKAKELKKGDGYIIDSLGWAYYAKQNYSEAKFFLEKAVELLPLDPVINDHYADALWMLNKNIQARYVWNYVLKLEDTQKELKDSINKKLLFGIQEKL